MPETQAGEEEPVKGSEGGSETAMATVGTSFVPALLFVPASEEHRHYVRAHVLSDSSEAVALVG